MPGMLATSPIRTDTFCPTQAAVTNPCLTLPATVLLPPWEGKFRISAATAYFLPALQAAPGLGCWMHHSCTCAEMGACSSRFCSGLITSEALKIGCGWSEM